MDYQKNIALFLLGFISCAFLIYLIYSINFFNITGLNIYSPTNTASPPEIISKDKVLVKDNEIILYINNATLSQYYNTNSMYPTLDKNTKGIKIVPKDEKEIKVGSIISFREGEKTIAHRVIKIGEDGNGAYFITKGDNNSFEDKKIRFENIEYLLVGIIF